ncbi:hypothetical protein E2C01_055099 [Portunus trituberculatus]|uniref:Uncharacterized protein n=1 Tax=Portunus trituberculatus TaxID=210409 RepID=A0A5B7GTW3_PORTR|nr:hypothetical protein [Portunus trituberculatus]
MTGSPSPDQRVREDALCRRSECRVLLDNCPRRPAPRQAGQREDRCPRLVEGTLVEQIRKSPKLTSTWSSPHLRLEAQGPQRPA